MSAARFKVIEKIVEPSRRILIGRLKHRWVDNTGRYCKIRIIYDNTDRNQGSGCNKRKHGVTANLNP